MERVLKTMSLYQREKELTRKSGVDFSHRGLADIRMLRYDPDNPLHCDRCKEYLGIWHSVRYALFKKKGATYHIPCKKCRHVNKRVKGELGKQLDKRWEK